MNNENFRIIYEKYREFSVNAANKIVKNRTVAEDICQEVFFHLYEIRDTLDFSNEKKIRSLIFTATGNKCKDYFKKPWRKRENYGTDDREYRSVEDEKTDPEKILLRREEMEYRKQVLEKLRRELPVVQRQAYQLADGAVTDQLTEEQAAQIAKWRQWSYYKLMYKEID